jgi:hypothetical protein
LRIRPWKPVPLIILLVGHTLACYFILPYVNWLRAGILWVGVNPLFDHFLGLPRHRYAVPAGYADFRFGPTAA